MTSDLTTTSRSLFPLPSRAVRPLAARKGWAIRSFGPMIDVLLFGYLARRALALGQDLNFDQLSYHFLYPKLLFSGQLNAQDPALFGGRFQNPLIHTPFFLAVDRFDPRVVTLLLVALHVLNLVLVRWIALHVGRELGLSPWTNQLTAGAVAIFGATSAVYLSEIGTTFGDPLVSIPLLLAVLVLVRQPRDDSWKTLSISGAVVGIAFGLKMTAGPFAAALALAVVLVATSRRSAVRRLAILLAASLAGFLAVAGWFMVQLMDRYRSPVFPFFNAIFRSPYFPSGNLRDERFGGDIIDALRLPVELANNTLSASEIPVRDLRWLSIAILLACSVGTVAVQMVHRRVGQRSRRAGSSLADRPASVIVCCFVFVGLALWSWEFGIIRYAIPAELLSGVLFMLLVAPALKSQRTLPIAVLGMSILLWCTKGVPDWGHVPYGERWYAVDRRAFDELPKGATLLTFVDVQPLTSVAAYASDRVRVSPVSLDVLRHTFGRGVPARA